MKYLYLSLQYLLKIDKGKRFLTLLIFALPSCLALAYYFPITGYLEWLINYTGSYSSYSELWLSLVERDTFKLGLLVLGCILLIFSISSITTLTIRSVRVGKMQVNNIFFLINENFFPSFFMMVFFIVSLLLLQSAICLFLFLWQTIPSFIISYILSIIVLLLGILLIIFICSRMALWLPLMSINGLRPFNALGTSFSKTHPHKKSLFSAYFFLIIIVVTLGFVALFLSYLWYLKWLINALNYTIVTVLFVVTSILAYFDIEQIAREDLTKRPYLRR